MKVSSASMLHQLLPTRTWHMRAISSQTRGRGKPKRSRKLPSRRSFRAAASTFEVRSCLVPSSGEGITQVPVNPPLPSSRYPRRLVRLILRMRGRQSQAAFFKTISHLLPRQPPCPSPSRTHIAQIHDDRRTTAGSVEKKSGREEGGAHATRGLGLGGSSQARRHGGEGSRRSSSPSAAVAAATSRPGRPSAPRRTPVVDEPGAAAGGGSRRA